MNRKGITLVEILIAGALWVAIIASFAYFLKVVSQQAIATERVSRALCEARSRMEELRSSPASAELEMIGAEVPPIRLYSLRSRYL